MELSIVRYFIEIIHSLIENLVMSKSVHHQLSVLTKVLYVIQSIVICLKRKLRYRSERMGSGLNSVTSWNCISACPFLKD